jgi:F-type H+-transporting ATPase subunit epsilon
MAIQVDIVTPRRSLFSGEVDTVVLPGVEGQMGILAGHAPLLTILDIGEIILRRQGQEDEFIAVSGGVVEVRPNQVTILADAAERAEEIDTQRATVAMERARSLLAERSTKVEERQSIEAALRRSSMRLKVAQRRHAGRRSGSSRLEER